MLHLKKNHFHCWTSQLYLPWFPLENCQLRCIVHPQKSTSPVLFFIPLASHLYFGGMENQFTVASIIGTHFNPQFLLLISKYLTMFKLSRSQKVIMVF